MSEHEVVGTLNEVLPEPVKRTKKKTSGKKKQKVTKKK